MITRVFILIGDDAVENEDVVRYVATVNMMCGVDVCFVRYDDLPPRCRREVAVFGERYCDEVVYDIIGSEIIENRIHFSKSKRAEIGEILRAACNSAKKLSGSEACVATSFDEVRKFVQLEKGKIKKLGFPDIGFA